METTNFNNVQMTVATADQTPRRESYEPLKVEVVEMKVEQGIALSDFEGESAF